MNERIKELAEQAGFTRRKFYDGGEYLDKPTTPISSICIDPELKKFAQLIVQECAEIASGTQVDEPPNDLFYGYNLGVNKAAENIKQHFGVEE